MYITQHLCYTAHTFGQKIIARNVVVLARGVQVLAVTSNIAYLNLNSSYGIMTEHS